MGKKKFYGGKTIGGDEGVSVCDICSIPLVYHDEKTKGLCIRCARNEPNAVSSIITEGGNTVPVTWSYNKPPVNPKPVSTTPTAYPSKGGGVHAFSESPCEHTGIKPVFALSNGTTFAGANSRGYDPSHADIVFDLAGVATTDKAFVESKNKRFASLNDSIHRPEVVRLHWQDMHPPPYTVGLKFWRQLLDAIEPKTRVVICCIGGHGRTGTCLASIGLVAGVYSDEEEAIEEIRKKHCKKAIESQSQIDYLAWLASSLKE